MLYAPQWTFTTPRRSSAARTVGASDRLQRKPRKQRWLNGVPEGKKADADSSRLVRAVGGRDLG